MTSILALASSHLEFADIFILTELFQVLLESFSKSILRSVYKISLRLFLASDLFLSW